MVHFLRNNKLLTAILGLGLLLRLYRVRMKDLWYDEVLDVIQSQKSVIEIFHDVKLTPLHYLFVHFFHVLNSSILWLRVPSILFGVASLVILYFIVKKHLNRSTALFATFLLAISPMAIEFSQQILHYSYFVFFTLLSLYFYLDLIFERQFRVRTIVLFILFSLCNLATHLSAFIILCVEGVFFIAVNSVYYREFWQKLKVLARQKEGVVLLLILGVCFLAALLKTNYVGVMHAFTTFDLGRPIKVGYSLTHQLHTEYIPGFSLQFLLAMFSWFSQGRKWIFIYLIFFGIGLISLRKKLRLLFFFLTWNFLPFLLLFVMKIDHWFEEKYFIFILPIYLVVVAHGMTKLGETVLKKWKGVYYICLILFLLMISYRPIRSRTIYGFNEIGQSQYNWLEAFSKVKLNEGDAVFTLDDLYSRVYLGEENRYKSWYTDKYLGTLSPDEYKKLSEGSNTFYYLSIPDLINLKAGNLVNSEKLGVFGNINLYKISFLKSSPILFEGSFTDNYIKLDYVKNASDWKNVVISYFDFVIFKNEFVSKYQPLFLVPTQNDGTITYNFKLDKVPKNLFLKFAYLKQNPEDSITASITTSGGKKELMSPSLRKNVNEYIEETYDISTSRYEKEMSITFHLSKKSSNFEHLDLGLKYFSLYVRNDRSLDLLKDGDTFSYKTQLEADQKNKWLTDTKENFGWWQTDTGSLYRAIDENNPLIYEFSIPSGTNKGQFQVSTFTLDNGLHFSISNDGVQYESLASVRDERKYLSHDFAIDKKYIENKKTLFVKVESDAPNPQAILRNFIILLE